MSYGMIEGDRVRIISGSLVGMEAVIRKVDRHKRVAYIEMRIFGEIKLVEVGLEIVAKEIADRDHVQIVPSGYTAVNLLGLSTQVPMTLSYLTTGSTREVKIGNRSIKFKHAAPKNFAAKGQTVILIIQAFKELGKGNIGASEITSLKSYISQASDKHLIEEDLFIAPQWIQKIVKPLINNLEK